MQVKNPYKQYNFWAYIIFLILVFGSFAIVYNNLLSGQSERIVLYFVLSLMILFCGSLLFVISYLSQVKHVSELEKVEEHFVQKTNLNETQTQVIQEENAFNLADVIPETAKKLEDYADILLRNLSRKFHFVHGLLYVQRIKGSSEYTCVAQYASFSDKKPDDFKAGETLPGQVVKNKGLISISNIPADFIPVVSGLGKGAPRELIFIPLIYKDIVVGVIECASFDTLNDTLEKNLSQVAEVAAKNLFTLIKAN